MHTSLQLIELAKQRLAAKHGLELPMSDYRLGKLMGIRQTTISSWRVGRSHIGTEFAVRVADACELPPEYVYACVQRERADTPDEISLLERIAAAFKGTKAASLVPAVILAAMFATPDGAQAGNNGVLGTSAPNGAASSRCILLNQIRRWLRRWARLFTIFPVAALATGCAALQTPEERTWLALHAIDSAQTYRIAQDAGRCYHEANPITQELIGEFPSRKSVVAWSLGSAAVHAGVTEFFLRTERPGLAKTWQYLTIGAAGGSALHNFHIGIRIGAHNKPTECVR
jgi:hypothetical protein